MQRRINEAEGKAAEIIAVAEASAESIEKLAAVFASSEGGDALIMQVIEKYIDTMKALSNSNIILPAYVASYDGWIANLGLEKAVEGNSTQEKD